MAKKMQPIKIGGQAVLEGIMMRNGNKYSVAVRKPNKEIELKVDEYKGVSKGIKVLQLPFIRGIFNFIDSMVLGIKTLTYSAEFYEEEVVEDKKAENWFDRIFKDKAESVIMGITVLFSVAISVGLFMLLPLFISELLQKYIPFISSRQVPAIEAVVKITLFILYIVLISKMKDINTTFMYHGAEHKCINCIENGKVLTVKNVKKSSRYHKRCGTSFLLIVMVISIIFFMFIRSDNIWLRYGIRLLLIPVIAGISYEIIRLAGNSDNFLVKIISAPGMLMQKLTTKEPDEDMIEVAIVAVEAIYDWKEYLIKSGIEVIPEENENDESL